MGKNYKSKINNINPYSSGHFSIPPPKEAGKAKPTFSFIYMNHGTPTCLSHKDNKPIKSDIVDTLLMLSKIPWDEIVSKHIEGYHTIPVNQFRKALSSFITPDIKKLEVFKLSGKGRMAGLRRGDTFHIIQVRAEHDMY